MSFRSGDSVVVVSGSEMGHSGYITKLPPDHELVRTRDGRLLVVWTRHLHPYTEVEREQLPLEVLDRLRTAALEKDAEVEERLRRYLER